MYSRFVLGLLCFFAVPMLAFAQEGVHDDVYYVGTVDGFVTDAASDAQREVVVDLEDREGVVAEYFDDPTKDGDDLAIGDRVVVLWTQAMMDEGQFIIIDRYRLVSVGVLFLIFFGSAILFARKKGVSSVLGLAVSLLILMFYTVPTIVSGGSPFIVASISAFLIAVLSISIAHGFSRQTGIALVSTLVVLVFSFGLSQLFVSTAQLFGLGSEEAFSLTFSGLGEIDLRGLLLAGIIIGVLGVLDDVTTAQTATVKQLAGAGVKGFRSLYHRATQVGVEHVVSLVNTLALAYVGASLPLLLMFSVNEGGLPFWVILNSEMIIEEVIRILIGSIVLVLAVPISTVFAAYAYSRWPKWVKEGESGHVH